MLQYLGPILIPSWRFFDRIGDSLHIEYAWVPSPTSMDQQSRWQVFRPKPQRQSFSHSLLSLFWNPRGNELMYMLSCAEKILNVDSSFAADEIERRLRLACPAPEPHSYLMFRLKVGEQIAFVSEPRNGKSP